MTPAMTPYGKINKLLSEFNEVDNTVLIESPFNETTRIGQYLRSVVLALTTTMFIIATNCKVRGKSAMYRQETNTQSDTMLKIESIHALDTVKLTVFKKTLRHSLKVSFHSDVTRYFELGDIGKKKIFWTLWCSRVQELVSGPKLWPFTTPKVNVSYSNQQLNEMECVEIRDIHNQNEEKTGLKWTDKHLYLGSKREAEEKNRPIPIPGLGPTEEIELLYLKSRYFGCCDPAERWVQCEESTPGICDYNVYTYTGEPTSNVTYTSLMTTDSGSEVDVAKESKEQHKYSKINEVLVIYLWHNIIKANRIENRDYFLLSAYL